MKIKYKLILAIVVLFSLFIGANTFLIIVSEQKLTERINDNLLTINSLMVSEVEKSVQLRIEYWNVFTVLPTVRKTVSDSNSQFDKITNVSDLIAQRDREWLAVPKNELTPFMKKILDNEFSLRLIARKSFYENEYNYSIYPEVFVTNKYGAIIAATGKTSDYYQADEEWWQTAKEKGFYIGEVEYDESSETYSLVGALRIDDESGNFLGVEKFLVNTDEIVRSFNKIIAGEDTMLYSTTYFTLINGRSEVIYKSGEAGHLIPLSVHELEEMREFEKAGEKVLLIKSDIQGVDQELVVYKRFKKEGYLKDLNWMLVLEIERDILLAPVSELKNQSLLISLVIFVLALLLTIVLSRSIYNPIHQLHQAVEKMEKGNFVKTDILSKDELGLLGKAFNDMFTQLSAQQKKLVEQEKEKRKEIQRLNVSLDERVKQRTREVEQKKIEADEAKKATLNVLEDIQEAQKKLEQSFEELKGLDKLKTEFLSFTSHELRTPLTPIRAQLQRMLSKELPAKKRKESLEMVLRNTIRLDKLINDVLDISRIESNRLQVFKIKTDIKELINAVVTQMEVFAKEKNVKIKVDLKNCPTFISIDRDRVEQVFVNLIDNAIKHSGTKEILITGQKKGNKAELCVIDGGHGIPAEEIPHIFEAFKFRRSIKSVPKSAGLGLAISRGIVRAHGGNIWFKTKAGEGTKFCIDLPM